MTNPKMLAASELQNFLNKFRGLQDVADELVEIGSLEQARDQAQGHLVALNANIAKRNAEYAAEKAKREQEDAARKQHAEEHLAKEKALAEQVAANAKEAAGKMLAEAHAEAKEILSEARSMHDEQVGKAKEWEVKAKAAEVEHASHLRNIEDARREHGRITKIVHEMKSKYFDPQDESTE